MISVVGLGAGLSRWLSGAWCCDDGPDEHGAMPGVAGGVARAGPRWPHAVGLGSAPANAPGDGYGGDVPQRPGPCTAQRSQRRSHAGPPRPRTWPRRGPSRSADEQGARGSVPHGGSGSGGSAPTRTSARPGGCGRTQGIGAGAETIRTSAGSARRRLCRWLSLVAGKRLVDHAAHEIAATPPLNTGDSSQPSKLLRFERDARGDDPAARHSPPPHHRH